MQPYIEPHTNVWLFAQFNPIQFGYSTDIWKEQTWCAYTQDRWGV